MRVLFALGFVALVCGCICCGGTDLPLPGLSGQSKENAEACSAPYIQVGSECCLDDNDNSICDQDEATESTDAPEMTETTLSEEEAPMVETTETTEPTVSTEAPTTTATVLSVVTSTTLPPTTTIGNSCTDCVVLNLGYGWQEYMSSGYKFRFVEKSGAGQSLKYVIEVSTPEKLIDQRPISTGESFIDSLRLKVQNYGEDQPKVLVRTNIEDASSIPSNAALITIGGLSCATSGGGICERNFEGYKIRLISRFGAGAESSASIYVTPPSGLQEKVLVPVSGIGVTSDHSLAVGGFSDPSHFIQGGYNLFYVYLV
jgi:hypothetical protein